MCFRVALYQELPSFVLGLEIQQIAVGHTNRLSPPHNKDFSVWRPVNVARIIFAHFDSPFSRDEKLAYCEVDCTLSILCAGRESRATTHYEVHRRNGRRKARFRLDGICRAKLDPFEYNGLFNKSLGRPEFASATIALCLITHHQQR